ncbi:diacylglycerol/lipid kinase family protein [Amycolatopsis australiensis]|uniref:diacylglycerol/lipid kinase family protein n=1 Tax=Amycolatopsis australiensis TaxID=546364 RepID=UPI000931B16A|nr:diacylglycerol kinase family protein [Amycolatopsis australiensis]
MRAILIVNPQATSTTAGGRDVLAHALASQVKLDVVETDYRGHAMAVARSAARDGIDLVVAHGGDGTVNEVVNGLLADAVPSGGAPRAGGSATRIPATPGGPAGIGPVPALGVVPGGSANVFARALGISADPVEATHQLLNALEHDRSRRVGLGLADGHWFTFNSGLGWDADVVGRVAKRRGKQTTAGLYMRAAVRSYFRPPLGRPALTIHVPGEEPAEALTAFVSNTDPWSYLGERPVHLNPGCSFETGLGLFALNGLGLPTVFRHVRQALATKSNQRGRRLVRHDDLPMIRIDAAEPVNFQVDGDLVGQRTKVEFVSVPDALSVIV